MAPRIHDDYGMEPHDKRHGSALTLSDFQGQAQGGDDRRREERIACDKWISIRPSTDNQAEPFIHVRLADCSPGGLCLISKTPMASGDQFLTELRIDKTLLVLYTVRHCAAVGSSSEYKVGAEFSGVLSGPDDVGPEAILRALMDAAK